MRHLCEAPKFSSKSLIEEWLLAAKVKRMKKLTNTITICLTALFSGSLIAADQTNSSPEYLYNGITYMSMQSNDGSWMDTVWALEVEDTSHNLFDLVVSPAPKRMSIKVLTTFESKEWVKVWNTKLQALDLNSGLEQGDYAKSFMAVTEYLPEILNADDQFSIEVNADKALKLIVNGEELVTLDSANHFNFWMSAWMSAPRAGIYADGNMLAGGNIDSYLVDLLGSEAPSLDPSLVSAVF